MNIIQEAKQELREKNTNHTLFLNQKLTLDTFLSHGAISQAQYDKSLGDLSRKMGIQVNM